MPLAAKNPFEKGFLDLPKLFIKGSFHYIVFFVSFVAPWFPNTANRFSFTFSLIFHIIAL